MRADRFVRPMPTRAPLSTPRLFRRRRALGALGALAYAVALPAVAQRALSPTPAQTEGPFYPRTQPIERDADLTRIAGRAERARGTPLYLQGRVLATDGRALSGALMELWQCDAGGHYHHVGDPGPLDEAFQGYGTAITADDGRYAFVTIRPVPYPGRPPHLHFTLRHPRAAPLTTQLYVAGDDTSGDSVLSASARGTLARLTVALRPAPDREIGALEGSFDFVLAAR